MKILPTFFLAFASVPVLALATPAQLFYFENVPNNKQSLVFTYSKFCDSQQAPVGVQEFYSEKKYPVTTDKAAHQDKVRIVHLYVRHNGACKLVEGEKLEQKFPIPTSKQMTHVFVTADSDIEVRSEQ